MRFRDITKALPGGHVFEDYSLSSLVLMNSVFKEILYLDADVIALEDPTPLFSDPAYLRTGAVFWPVQNRYEASAHVLWEVLRSEPLQYKIDNAAMLVDRERHLHGLELAFYLSQRWRPLFFKWPLFINGDADMYVFAWLALSAPFHLVSPNADVLGWDCTTDRGGAMQRGGFCGHSVLLRHPNRTGDVLFQHRARNKFSYLPRVDLPSNAVRRAQQGLYQGEVERAVGGANRTCIDFFSEFDGRVLLDGIMVAPAKMGVAEQMLAALRDRLVVSPEQNELRPAWWSVLREFIHAEHEEAKP